MFCVGCVCVVWFPARGGAGQVHRCRAGAGAGAERVIGRRAWCDGKERWIWWERGGYRSGTCGVFWIWRRFQWRWRPLRVGGGGPTARAGRSLSVPRPSAAASCSGRILEERRLQCLRRVQRPSSLPSPPSPTPPVPPSPAATAALTFSLCSFRLVACRRSTARSPTKTQTDAGFSDHAAPLRD
jgi:hypothetical protein